jgi:CheY-like chemotaxis protein
LVTDTGAGISPENLQLLFEPFERLGAETTAIEGTGVGLALSKGLVEQMGGSIDVRSEVDRGSTFKVVLASATAPTVAAASPPARSARDASVAPGGPTELVTVLHIEDNLANLRLVERILSRRENISLVSAQTAELGLELAVAQQPALMLLDLHLPDLHGLEVLQRLRRDPRTHEIPVVILSGDATEAQRDRCLEQGAHAYLTKPFDVAGLLAVVDDVVSARR